MSFILANYELIIFIVLVILLFTVKIVQFVRTPSEKRQELIREWLVEAVTIAEQKFGSKAGEQKYAFVYSLFVAKYKWFGRFIPKSLFNKLVDEALETMHELSKGKKK